MNKMTADLFLQKDKNLYIPKIVLLILAEYMEKSYNKSGDEFGNKLLQK